MIAALGTVAGVTGSDVLGYEAGDGRCVITLNRPDVLNAINQELRDALRGAVTDATDDDVNLSHA